MKLNIIIIAIGVKVFWPQVVLANAIVILQVYVSFVLRIEYCFYLVTSYDARPKLMSQDDGLNHQLPVLGIRWEPFLESRKGSLQRTHTPLTGLPQRNIHVAQSQQVFSHYWMQPPCTSLVHRPNKNVPCIPTLRETLINTNFVVSNPPSN